MSSRSWIFHYFWFSHIFKGDNCHIYLLVYKTSNFGFFWDIIEVRSFKLCMVMTLLGIYVVNLHLMTLTLFQGHRCVRNVTCKLWFWILVLCSLKHCMVASYIKEIMHNMICVTVVYSGKVIYIFFDCQVFGLVKNFDIGIYWDMILINVINVKLFMMALLIELYLFIPLSVTWIIFQGHSNVRQLQLKILYLLRCKRHKP